MLVALGKLRLLDFFIGKGLYHPDAQQAVLHLRIDFTHLGVAQLESAAHFPVVIAGKRHHQRHHRKHHQREGHIHAAQDHKADDDFDSRNQKFLRAMMGKLCHLKQIGGDAGHNLPNLRFAVIIEGQLLQMMEQIGTHVVFQLGAHDMPHGLHKIVCRSVNNPQEHIQPAQLENERHRQRGNVHRGALGNGAH